MNRRPALILSVFLLALLAGCGGMPSGATPVSAPAASRTRPPGGEGPTPPLAVTEPARLKGLTVTQVQSVLGAPSFKRRDPPAEIWQYRGRHCTLDLFLYDGTAGQQVEHYSIRGPASVSERDCFNELLASAAPGS